MTSADGNRALSTTVCGSERLSVLFCLLIAYSVIKYRDVIIDALQDAFPLQPCEAHVLKCNTLIVEAISSGTWGSDYHMFALSLLLDQPILCIIPFI